MRHSNFSLEELLRILKDQPLSVSFEEVVEWVMSDE